ncbi:MAG: hypothetical protein V2G34_04290 [bacterium JZ-2024 1]
MKYLPLFYPFYRSFVFFRRFWPPLLALSLLFWIFLLILLSLSSFLFPALYPEITFLIGSPFLIGYMNFLAHLKANQVPSFGLFFSGWKEPLLFPSLGISAMLVFFFVLFRSVFSLFIPHGRWEWAHILLLLISWWFCLVLAFFLYPRLIRNHRNLWEIWSSAWYALLRHKGASFFLIGLCVAVLLLAFRSYVLFPLILPIIIGAVLELTET